MNRSKLVERNRTYFRRYYRLVAFAVIITTAVIAGSLLIGDSVRATLVSRVNERLGQTETIVYSMQSFMDSSMVHQPAFEGHTRAILMTNGFVSHSSRLIPVMVYGINDMSIPRGQARINQTLAKELNHQSSIINHQSSIALRLPATGIVPSGSLFVTDNYTTSMRLTVDGIVDVKQQGNLSMRNEQTLPLNIFVNRDELAETLETQGKVNLLLSDRIITQDELDQAWNPALSGLQSVVQDDFVEITSDRIFIPDEVVQAISGQYPGTNRLFSYLVNSIGIPETRNKAYSIPYSFVTAMDCYNGITLNPDEIIISDYTAQRLAISVNDTLSLTFFTSEDLKTLRSDTVSLRISRIVPIRELVADSTISADFPGLSNVDHCTEWDSDLPIDMTLITDEDEQYWTDYRATPKAIISYQAVADKWSGSFGSATALRISCAGVSSSISPFGGGRGRSSFDSNRQQSTAIDMNRPVSPASPTSTVIARNEAISFSTFNTQLSFNPAMFGIQLTHPRESAFQAARGGVDFSGLFLSLGFFIIISAVLLLLVPLSEMIFQRKDETALMYSLGYPTKRIVKFFRMEAVPVVLRSAVAGVIAGLIYTWFVLFLLGTVWKGATHTEGFRLYPHVGTILIGLTAGILLSVSLIWVALKRMLYNKVKRKSGKQIAVRRKLIYAIVVSLIVLLIAIINQAFIQSVVLFVAIGATFIGATALWGDYLICSYGRAHENKPFNLSVPVWAMLYAGRKQALLSFFSLSMGVFIVFSVGLNRQGFADSSQMLTGTGGYALWCESSVPVYHNLSTSFGREKLALTELPAETEVLQLLRYGADDASCLNLNKVSNPTVLGVDMEQLSRSHFEISTVKDDSLETDNMFDVFRTRTDSVYPVLVDETVLTWGLALQLGDTIVYESSKGQRVALRLAGTLRNSIFQGNLLLDRKLFMEIWDDIAGSEVMLVKVSEDKAKDVSMLISQALSEYGVSVMTTNDRMKMFNSVTDTYLTIFLMLGSIGLLLGIMSFIIVVRKNLVSRREEIHVYRSLGFPDRKITKFLRLENNVVPLYAIGIGIIGAIIAAGGGIANVSLWVWLTSFVFALLFVVCVIVFVQHTVESVVEQGIA